MAFTSLKQFTAPQDNALQSKGFSPISLDGLIFKLLEIRFRRQSSRSLRHLDDRLLEDIGISREQAEQELNRSIVSDWLDRK